MFSDISAAPPVEVFKLSADYQADTFPTKVSLGVGAYRDDAGKPWILPVVKKAEMQLAKDVDEEKIKHDYLCISKIINCIELIARNINTNAIIV